MAKKSRFPRAVKNIVVVDPASAAQTVVLRRRGGKKRGSPGLRQLQKMVRRVVRAQEAFSSSYLARHDRSNRRRKDGWLRDIVENVARAIAPASRKITR